MPRSAARLITILIFLLAPPLLLLLLALAGGSDRAAAQNFTSTPCGAETSELAPSFMPPDVTSVNAPQGTSSPTPSATSKQPCATPSTVPLALDSPQSGSGLRAEYFKGITFGERVALYPQANSPIDLTYQCPSVPISGVGMQANSYSIRWMGQVEAPVTGYYQFVTYSDDGVRLWLNGEKLTNDADLWNIHSVKRAVTRSIYLTAGQKADIRLDYYQGQCDDARMKLAWIYPGQTEQTIPAARLYATTSPDTIGIYRFVGGQTGGIFYLRNSNTTGYSDFEIQLSYAQAGDIPIVGDWDGDGIDSVGLYRPTGKKFFLDNNDFPTGQALESPAVIIVPNADYSFDISYSGGSGNYVPIVGKWSDGLTTGHLPDRVGLYDPTNNNFVFRTTISGTATPATPVSTAMGATPIATDKPVYGDWSANTFSYNGIFRPSNGLWYLVSVSPFVYGSPDDIAVVGDWDGDFDDGVGIYRKDNAAFHLKYVASGGAADLSFTYGNVGDQYPVAGRWAYQPLMPVTATAYPTPTYGSCTFNVVATNPNPNNSLIGVALRESPTGYSPRLTTVPWNTQNLTAVYRLDIDSQPHDDIWYQTTYTDQNNTIHTGWFAAKIDSAQYATNITCSLPSPYNANWQNMAQITQTEILNASGGVCTSTSLDNYLRTEPGELVLARVAFAEAATLNLLAVATAPGVTLPDSTGTILYEDAYQISWIARLGAFMGLPNYGSPNSVAGSSVPIHDQILHPGQYQPITQARLDLVANNCDPTALAQGNVRSMLYPENISSFSSSFGATKADLYVLWRIYQRNLIDLTQKPWITMPSILRGFEQFKGEGIATPCPAGADQLMRPGSGFSWATNQPYPPKTVMPYITSGDQARKTCYQDAYHLDDLFWDALVGAPPAPPDLAQQPTSFAVDLFPKSFTVVILCNPADHNDKYPLAQLTGLNGTPWPWPPAIC